jgi:hypothetical protein
MRTLRVFLTVFAVAGAACGKPAPLPPIDATPTKDPGSLAPTDADGGAEADLASAATADASMAQDAGSDLDADPGTDATSASDIPDSADGDVPAVEVGDTADAADMPQDVSAWTSGVCEVKGPPLPWPGEACKTAGEMRCTPVGSKPMDIVGPGLNGTQIGCQRPNMVKCEKAADGILKWMQYDCMKLLEAQGAPSKCTFIKQASCQENERGVFCCPRWCPRLNGVPDPGSIVPFLDYQARLCPPADKGLKNCGLGELTGLYQCGFRDEFPEAEAMNEHVFKQCGKLCTNCLHWYAFKKCPQLYCPPKKVDPGGGGCEFSQEGCQEYYPAYCVPEPKGGVHCMTECKELGIKGY